MFHFRNVIYCDVNLPWILLISLTSNWFHRYYYESDVNKFIKFFVWQRMLKYWISGNRAQLGFWLITTFSNIKNPHSYDGHIIHNKSFYIKTIVIIGYTVSEIQHLLQFDSKPFPRNLRSYGRLESWFPYCLTYTYM